MLAAASWPEGGTAIVLEGKRVRTYYGPAFEKIIAVGPVAAFWMREELVLLRKSGDGHRTTPGDILVELDAAHDAVQAHGARVSDLNPECCALQGAIFRTRHALRMHATADKPRVALKDALRALDKALVPFGVDSDA